MNHAAWKCRLRLKFARLHGLAQRGAASVPVQSPAHGYQGQTENDAPMSTSATLPYTGLATALDRCHLAIDPSELHGVIAGYRALRHSEPVASWLALCALECDEEATAERLLAALAASSTAQLADPAMRFAPLMPPDSAPLAQRARALVAFCGGFLSGVGLAGGNGMSAEAEEALADLGRIAASREQFEEEDDEASLVELQEFVRVAVLLLFEDGRAGDGVVPREP